MAELINMVFGKATVEIVESANRFRHPSDTVVEPVNGSPGLVWVRVHVYSMTPTRTRDGYIYTLSAGGASGWVELANARNFQRLPCPQPCCPQCGGKGVAPSGGPCPCVK